MLMLINQQRFSFVNLKSQTHIRFPLLSLLFHHYIAHKFGTILCLLIRNWWNFCPLQFHEAANEKHKYSPAEDYVHLYTLHDRYLIIVYLLKFFSNYMITYIVPGSEFPFWLVMLGNSLYLSTYLPFSGHAEHWVTSYNVYVAVWLYDYIQVLFFRIRICILTRLLT